MPSDFGQHPKIKSTTQNTVLGAVTISWGIIAASTCSTIQISIKVATATASRPRKSLCWQRITWLRCKLLQLVRKFQSNAARARKLASRSLTKRHSTASSKFLISHRQSVLRWLSIVVCLVSLSMLKGQFNFKFKRSGEFKSTKNKRTHSGFNLASNGSLSKKHMIRQSEQRNKFSQTPMTRTTKLGISSFICQSR
jgi:hypothetical protein